MIRFRTQFEDDWTEVSFSGLESDIAKNILITRLLARDCEVEVLSEDNEWEEIE